MAAAIVALIAWGLIRSGDDKSGGSKVVVAEDAAGVQKLASEQSDTPYWAGPGGAQTFEWTRTSDGRVYVRYLANDVIGMRADIERAIGLGGPRPSPCST